MTSSDPADRALVGRAQAGDEDAFHLLFGRYESAVTERIRRLLPASVNRKVSTSDVLQETYAVAFERFSEFEHRGEGSFRNWLLRIADLKVRKAVQLHAATAKRAVGREISRGQRPDTAAFAGRGPSPSEAAIGSELQERARQAIGSLPEDYATVLRLAIEEQLTLREVAERIGRSREATKKLYGRALSRFAEVFEKRTGGRHA